MKTVRICCKLLHSEQKARTVYSNVYKKYVLIKLHLEVMGDLRILQNMLQKFSKFTNLKIHRASVFSIFSVSW